MGRIITRWIAAPCCAASALFCAPQASACISGYATGFAFHDTPPSDMQPGEVALEVEFMGEASSVVRAALGPDPDEGERPPQPQYEGEASAGADEYPFWTSCGGFVAYKVKRVLHGAFDGQAVLVGPLVLMLDETWNPLRKRILVGKPGTQPIKAALMTVKDWREHVFFGTHIEVRLARSFEASELDKALMLPELVAFGIARLIGYGVSFIPGVEAVSVDPWTGITILVVLLGAISWLVWRRRARQRRTPD